MSTNCTNIWVVNQIKLIDCYCERVEAIVKDDSGKVKILCSGYFREANVGDSINIAGSKNWDGKYNIQSIRSDSRFLFDSDDSVIGNNGSKKERYIGRSIIILDEDFTSIEERYDGQQGGYPAVYLDRGVKIVVDHKGDLQNYQIDTWTNESEEINNQESAELSAGPETQHKNNKTWALHSEIPQAILTDMQWHYTDPGTYNASDVVPDEFEEDPSDWVFSGIKYKPETVLFVNDKTSGVLSTPAMTQIIIKQPYSYYEHRITASASATGSEGSIAKGASDTAYLTNLATYLSAVLPDTMISGVEVKTVSEAHLTTEQLELVISMEQPGEHTTLTIDIIDLATGQSLVAGKTTSIGKAIAVYNQYPDSENYSTTDPFASITDRWFGLITDGLLFPNLTLTPGGSMGGHLFGLKSIKTEVAGGDTGGITTGDIKTVGTVQLLVGGKAV